MVGLVDQHVRVPLSPTVCVCCLRNDFSATQTLSSLLVLPCSLPVLMEVGGGAISAFVLLSSAPFAMVSGERQGCGVAEK